MESQIKKLNPSDIDQFTELIQLFEVVFEMKNFSIPPTEHLKKLLNQNHFHVFVSLIDDRIVGGLTVYTLEQYYSTQPLAYIYDLAVDNNLQRKGIGKKLIAFTQTYFKEKGYEEVFVQADRDEDHAVNFYRSTQPTEGEDVIHFYYSLNP